MPQLARTGTSGDFGAVSFKTESNQECIGRWAQSYQQVEGCSLDSKCHMIMAQQPGNSWAQKFMAWDRNQATASKFLYLWYRWPEEASSCLHGYETCA